MEAVDRADSFAAAFFALKRIFAPHVKHLHVNADTRTRFYLETKAPTYKGKPLFFGAVISGRANVSFHLMPLYWDESLRKKISPELKKRMQRTLVFQFHRAGPRSVPGVGEAHFRRLGAVPAQESSVKVGCGNNRNILGTISLIEGIAAF